MSRSSSRLNDDTGRGKYFTAEDAGAAESNHSSLNSRKAALFCFFEFSFFSDEFFTRKGIRDKVNITYVTPMSGAFTKPKASKMLGSLLEKKGIKLVPDFFLGEVDNTNFKIIDFGGQEVPFDCLVTIPLHSGDPVISKSGLGD